MILRLSRFKIESNQIKIISTRFLMLGVCVYVGGGGVDGWVCMNVCGKV